MKVAIFSAISVVLALPAQAGLHFSCADAGLDAKHRAVFGGTIRRGLEKLSHAVEAELDSLEIYEEDKLKLKIDLPSVLRGQGFLTATGARQFDLDSDSSSKVGAISLQLSVAPGKHDVVSYLTLNRIRYQAHCERVSPLPDKLLPLARAQR